MKAEFYQLIAGNVSAAMYAAGLLFAFVGFVLSIGIQVLLRNKKSLRTPDRFSPAFLWKDNKERIIVSTIVNILAVLVTMRFCKEITGVDLSPILTLTFGFGLDKLVERLSLLSKNK